MSFWKGTFKGTKGYKVWKFETSQYVSAYTPAARYTNEGLFYIVYRRKCPEVDKKILTAGLRKILGFKGHYINVVEYDAGTVTIGFYCFLDTIPSDETMFRLEDYLSTADYFSYS